MKLKTFATAAALALAGIGLAQEGHATARAVREDLAARQAAIGAGLVPALDADLIDVHHPGIRRQLTGDDEETGWRKALAIIRL